VRRCACLATVTDGEKLKGDRQPDGTFLFKDLGPEEITLETSISSKTYTTRHLPSKPRARLLVPPHAEVRIRCPQILGREAWVQVTFEPLGDAGDKAKRTFRLASGWKKPLRILVRPATYKVVWRVMSGPSFANDRRGGHEAFRVNAEQGGVLDLDY
jgi:hypothetical protein